MLNSSNIVFHTVHKIILMSIVPVCYIFTNVPKNPVTASNTFFATAINAAKYNAADMT